MYIIVMVNKILVWSGYTFVVVTIASGRKA